MLKQDLYFVIGIL